MNLTNPFKILILITLSFLFFHGSLFAESRSPVKPLLYPVETVSNNHPWFIWKDVYAHKDGKGTKYRITLKAGREKTEKPLIFMTEPVLYYNSFYVFRLPATLEKGKYSYVIDRMFNNRPVKSRYFEYLDYPVRGDFILDMSETDRVDYLPPEDLIRYKYYEKENILNNKYNFLFYSASSTLALGIGYLFYSVIQLGTISTVITVLCVLSAAAGFPAAGYYGFRYMQGKSKMNDILELGSHVKIKGSAGKEGINTKAELRF